MDNGCPKCKEIEHKHCRAGQCVKNHRGITCSPGGVQCEHYIPPPGLCLNCQLEQAEATTLQAMNKVEEIKQKLKKEKENAIKH